MNAYQELLNKTYSLVDEGADCRIGKYLIRQSVCLYVGRVPGLAASEDGASVYAYRCGYRFPSGQRQDEDAGSVSR